MRARIDPTAPQHRGEVPRGPYVSPTLRDPGVEVGPFRVLPRADGKWILYDERKPFGQRTALVADSEAEATMTAKVWLATASQVASTRAQAARGAR